MKLTEIHNTILSELHGGDLIAYHGSPQAIDKFVDDFVGGEEAHDQEGPGIYFTTSYDEARGYGEYVYKVRIKGGTFLDDENPSGGVDIEEVKTLMRMAEDWEDKAQNFDENPESGLEVAADGAISYNDTEKDVFLQAWIEFYRYDPIDYVRNMAKIGYDGLIINRRVDTKHIIMYKLDTIEYLGREE